MTPVEVVLYSGTAILSVGTTILVLYYFFRRDEPDPEDDQNDWHD